MEFDASLPHSQKTPSPFTPLNSAGPSQWLHIACILCQFLYFIRAILTFDSKNISLTTVRIATILQVLKYSVITRQAMYVSHNNEARVQWKSNEYYVFLRVCMQPQVPSMQCASSILSSVACPPLQYFFSTLSHKWHDYKKSY